MSLTIKARAENEPPPWRERPEWVRLPDGRYLAWETFGDPDGVPALLFHGLPSSRLQARMHHPQAAETGVQLIAFDRPGMGWSDFDPNRTLASVARDVAALLDHLGLEKVHLFGGSGGTPYLLATALALPERVNRAALFGCLGPIFKPEVGRHFNAAKRRLFRLARKYPPGLICPVAASMREFVDPRQIQSKMRARLGPYDRQAITDPFMWSWLLEEPFRQGMRGVYRDLRLLGGPWLFENELLNLRLPLRIWHGEGDVVCPIEFSEHVHALLPEATELVRVPNLGHYMNDPEVWRGVYRWLAAGGG
ncbi:MAG: alpha/beta fold hydrolase [Opitutales bacterium]